jgi:hypothetical protein
MTPSTDPTIQEINQWFFGEYLPTWVSIGASEDGDPSLILEFWGVPMHAASLHMTSWLRTPEAVLDLLAANHAPLRALGYTHTNVIDQRIVVYNHDAASIDAIWSRCRADEVEVERVAAHFEVRRTGDGWRVIAVATTPTDQDSLDEVWRESRGGLAGNAERPASRNSD